MVVLTFTFYTNFLVKNANKGVKYVKINQINAIYVKKIIPYKTIPVFTIIVIILVQNALVPNKICVNSVKWDIF